MADAVDARFFPAKLLLFGEHVLLLGAEALAVPVPRFGGRWVLRDAPNRHLGRMREFAMSKQVRAIRSVDADRFLSELADGLAFESNIPTGYGLGSSGALCAAVYHRYAVEKTSDPVELKRIFAQMESFFHGSSSGIDPLTSYLDRAVFIKDKSEVTVLPAVENSRLRASAFLLDSRLPRRTGPLVSWFLAQTEQGGFKKILEHQYLPAHRRALGAWLSGDAPVFWPNIQHLSLFQLEHLAPLVPETARGLWAEGLRTGRFFLKLCGAGGGGFVLGFAKDSEVAQSLAHRHDLVFPFEPPT